MHFKITWNVMWALSFFSDPERAGIYPDPTASYCTRIAMKRFDSVQTNGIFQ